MPAASLTLGNTTFSWGSRTYVMAIVNATPDSFSGDGVIGRGGPASAALIARAAVADGADVVDIGGVPTFPGAAPVSWAEERARVVPVIEAVSAATSGTISVDTCRAEVAEAALDAGAHLVNSAWGLRLSDGSWNQALAEAVAGRDAALVLTHNRRAVAARAAYGGYYPEVPYADVVTEVLGDLRAQVDYAMAHGIPQERLIVDYGLGLGKTPEQNLLLLDHLPELREFGCPVLLAHSRKSFIGHVVGGEPTERDGGTAALTALGIAAGVDMVRVHNVGLNAQASRMTDALVRQSSHGEEEE